MRYLIVLLLCLFCIVTIGGTVYAKYIRVCDMCGNEIKSDIDSLNYEIVVSCGTTHYFKKAELCSKFCLFEFVDKAEAIDILPPIFHGIIYEGISTERDRM